MLISSFWMQWEIQILHLKRAVITEKLTIFLRPGLFTHLFSQCNKLFLRFSAKTFFCLHFSRSLNCWYCLFLFRSYSFFSFFFFLYSVYVVQFSKAAYILLYAGRSTCAGVIHTSTYKVVPENWMIDNCTDKRLCTTCLSICLPSYMIIYVLYCAIKWNQSKTKFFPHVQRTRYWVVSVLLFWCFHMKESRASSLKRRAFFVFMAVHTVAFHF